VQARGVLERRDDARRLEPLAAPCPDHDPDVDQERDHDRVDEVLGHQVEALDHAPDQARAQEARDAPDERAHHVVGRDAVEPRLEADDRERRAYAERDSREVLTGQGVIVPTGPAQGENDHGAEQDEPHDEASRALARDRERE
jgi:hypothetical protein